MVGVRPIGYATREEFQQRLRLTLPQNEVDIADLYLRAAEEIVDIHTGGRIFLPVRTTLAAEIDDDDTTLTFGSDGVRFPEFGLLVIDDEVIEYEALTVTYEADEIADVSAVVVSRGYGTTTAATHTATTYVYEIRGLSGEGLTRAYPGDFVRLVKAWSGWTQWTEIAGDSFAYLIPGPRNSTPRQWIERSGGEWSKDAQYSFAAIWGYGWSVPAGIKTSTLRLAEEMWQLMGRPSSIVAMEQIESHITQFRQPEALPKDVMGRLEQFRRRTV